MAKLLGVAAKNVRAGHPWVFRDSLSRPLEGLETGATVHVVDDEGQSLGLALVEGQGAVALRMLGLDAGLRWDRAEIEARVRAAAVARDQLLEPGVRRCCRVVHGEADGLPGLAVDLYADYAVVYVYSNSAAAYLDLAIEAVVAVHAPRGVYVQSRVRPVAADEARPGAEHRAGELAPNEVLVEEDGLRFAIDVTAPVSPGLFLDLREGRRWCESLAGSRRVLNLFSFTGAFALRAVRAGAREVVNVDALARSHARCRVNLERNGFDAEACEAVTGDAIAQLERMRRRNRLFELVIVDPPPFSKVGGHTFSALRDWHQLIAAIVPVVAPGGYVLAVSNAIRQSDEDLLLAIGRGSQGTGRAIRLVGERGLPADFPVIPSFVEGRYLKVKLLHVR